MSLSSLQLDAFLAVASHLSFTKAAQSLCLTQSALSQRINNLELKLGTLFIRTTKMVYLTPLGNQLLSYCRKKKALEDEFLGQLDANSTNSLNGVIRIAGISTALRTQVLPALNDILVSNPCLRLELLELELRELPTALENNQTDFIVTSNQLDKRTIEMIHIGFESYVLAESTQSTSQVNDVYLDHDLDDETTYHFLKHQKNPPISWRQHYLDNIHLIIEAVKLGMGRAVLPSQIVAKEKCLRKIKGMKPLNIPLYLIFFKQDYYTQLQKAVIKIFIPKKPENSSS